MTNLNLKEIRARADAATTGPWTTGVRWEDPYDVYWVPVNSPSTNENDPNQPERVALIRYNAGAFQFPHADAKADAEFIAHAREDVPALVAEIDRLRAELDRRQAVVDAACQAVNTDGVDEWNELVDAVGQYEVTETPEESAAIVDHNLRAAGRDGLGGVTR